MTKEVQIVGSPRESQDAFVGADREITVDTSNRGLRVHDGVTAGGHMILNRDDNDARYQAASPELAGLIGFEPQEHGIVIRLGAANYRVGAIQGAVGQITVTDGNGFANNPVLSLPSTITLAIQFSEAITFAERATFNDGLTGDTYGDHTGDSFGLHIGDVVGDVSGDAHGNHTGTFQGDVDVVGHALHLEANQIPAGAIDGLQSLITATGVQTGIIALWSGDIPSIPTGWALCDGTNGTPNLAGLFIRGASVANLPGAVGGAETHTHTGTTATGGAHTHTGTAQGTGLTVDQMPSHTHMTGLGLRSADISAAINGTAAVSHPKSMEVRTSDSAVAEPLSKPTGAGAPHTHTLSVVSGGAHTHGFASDPASNLPPWFALAYIMKL